MEKHLILVLVGTLVMGLLTGAFLFFTTRVPDTVPPPVEEQFEGFEIVGYTYGGCARTGCTSYRLQDDGSYTFIMRAPTRGDTRAEDAISAKQLDAVRSLVEGADLDTLEARAFSGTCPASYDGIAYRFEIRRDADAYRFDSCVEAIAGEPLFDLLIDYFTIMYALHHDPA